MMGSTDPRHHETGPIDRWKPEEMVRYDNMTGSFILTFGWQYAFETDWPDGPEVRERTEHLLFYKVKERLIREGLATLLNDQLVATLPCPPVEVTIVPTQYVRRPVLLMPFPEGYELIKSVMDASNIVNHHKINWEEYI